MSKAMFIGENSMRLNAPTLCRIIEEWLAGHIFASETPRVVRVEWDGAALVVTLHGAEGEGE